MNAGSIDSWVTQVHIRVKHLKKMNASSISMSVKYGFDLAATSKSPDESSLCVRH